jgi:hypothetical protein
MPFSDSLASRTRDALSRRRGITEQKMFGGLGFLLRGNLLVDVFRDSLIVRLGPDQAKEALNMPNVREFVSARYSQSGRCPRPGTSGALPADSACLRGSLWRVIGTAPLALCRTTPLSRFLLPRRPPRFVRMVSEQ